MGRKAKVEEQMVGLMFPVQTPLVPRLFLLDQFFQQVQGARVGLSSPRRSALCWCMEGHGNRSQGQRASKC